MSALMNGLPGTRRRTRMSAAPTPKIALRGTAMSAMITVR
jgi:hypothetical protein